VNGAFDIAKVNGAFLCCVLIMNEWICPWLSLPRFNI
jgi:hypothetical protein